MTEEQMIAVRLDALREAITLYRGSAVEPFSAADVIGIAEGFARFLLQSKVQAAE